MAIHCNKLCIISVIGSFAEGTHKLIKQKVFKNRPSN